MLDKLPDETEAEYERTEALATVARIIDLAEVGIWALVARDPDTVAEALANIHFRALKARQLLRGETQD